MELIKLKYYNNINEARRVQELLKVEGIYSSLREVPEVGGRPHYMQQANPIGLVGEGAEVMVSDQDLAQAMEVLGISEEDRDKVDDPAKMFSPQTARLIKAGALLALAVLLW